MLQSFLFSGGDDVQQLCDAGEEEFLEIMALIGMASKPLHVRRLQKALHEWITNPTLFQLPLISINLLHQSNEFSGFHHPVASPPTTTTRLRTSKEHDTSSTPTTPMQLTSSIAESRWINPHSSSIPTSPSSPGPPPGSPGLVNPNLTEAQLSQICESARRLSRLLPNVEPKQNCTKKKLGKEVEVRKRQLSTWRVLFSNFFFFSMLWL